MKAVTHLEKVITGEVSAVTHLEKVIAEETSAVTYTEKVIAGEATPITHLEKVIAGIASPVTHLEQVWAGRTPEPTEHEYTGAVPVEILADGTPLLDYLISGNMSQSGTPTHTTPIQPQETGERTGNLYFKKIVNANISDSGVITTLTGFDLYIAKVEQGVQYSGNGYIYAFFEDVPASDSISFNGSRVVNSLNNIVSPINGFVAVRNPNTAQNAMCNTGSSILPYEPYGYKLTISSGGENLFDGIINDGYYNDSGSLIIDDSKSGHSNLIKADNTTYTISGLWVNLPNFAVYEWDDNKQFLRRTNRQPPPQSTITFSLNNDAGYFSLQLWNNSERYNPNLIMLNRGSTALPYEPYIEPTETNIYLGEVQTTRKIVKYEFTGQEKWYVEGSDIFYTDPITEAVQYVPICSHFFGVDTLSGNNQVTISQSLRINIKTNSITHTASDFKTYLQQQYAAGTPVTVWYVLAEPETAVVNEPLRKIGDYADTVSMEQAGVQIPTNRGNTVIDVETTLKPSEMYIKYQE